MWSILGAYLLLPVGTEVDLPLIPPFDKVSIPNLAAFFCCRFILGRQIKVLPREGLARLLLLIYMMSPFVTAMLNPDPIYIGAKVIQGMTYYDAFSSVVNQFIYILPFMLGRYFLNLESDLENILRALALAGLLYSLPMLLEIRMSPQLHSWIYGYFPHSFAQQVREGGFRPVVFLGHGLLVAFFAMTSLLAAAALARLKLRIHNFSANQVFIYLGMLLVLCKSLASLAYGVSLSIVIRFLSPANQMRIAVILVCIAFVYPVLRVVDMFPTEAMTNAAVSFSKERAQSFSFRLENEEMLLEHLEGHRLFGWGNWGRGRVYNPDTGEDISVTDGRWIIALSQYGFFGFVAEFGLLILPVLACSRIIKHTVLQKEKFVLCALCLILSINVVDLLINASNTPFTWLLAGTLLGRATVLSGERRKNLKTQSI